MKQTNTQHASQTAQNAAALFLAKYEQQDSTAAACGFDSYITMYVELNYFCNGYGVLAMMSQAYGLRCAFVLLNA